jgi:excisionase family DNA binding protein
MAGSMANAERAGRLSDGKDEAYGYEFAVDGLMTVEDACKHLAVSVDTIQRRCADGTLRWWKDPAKRFVRLCRRSVNEYIRRGEM